MFIEINSNSINYHGERICGDSFVQRYIPNQRRTVAVLSDGMGHGTKANILSVLTSSIIVNMGEAQEAILKIANTILKTLPVCSVRGISYATFTILDIDHVSRLVQVLEYDNPQALIFRGVEQLKLKRHERIIINDSDEDIVATRRTTLYMSEFVAQEGDRIVICSDGVTQSGLGTDRYPFGWGQPAYTSFVKQQIIDNRYVTSNSLSLEVLSAAWENDEKRSKDDITCSVFTFRPSKRLLLCSCPPSTEDECDELANRIVEASEPTIICGYTLAEMVADRLNSSIRKNLTSTDPDLPPLWFVDGVDLITEGFLTLTKVLDILEHYEEKSVGRGPAYRIVKMIMACDHIQMVIGMRETEMESKFVDNYQIRRQLLERISDVLETKFIKAVTKTYL